MNIGVRPADPEGTGRMLRRAVELGVTVFDLSGVEHAAPRALHDRVVVTRVGLTRPGTSGHPQELRSQVDRSLRILGLPRIPLLQLHRIDPTVPLADQLGALTQLQAEGKVQHLGLCEVTVGQLRSAQELAPVTAVENVFNVAQRRSGPVLEYCEANGITFVPGAPLATGRLTHRGGLLGEVGRRVGATPAQVALAWLLRRSRVMLPIPSVSSEQQLEEDLRGVVLPDEDFALLDRAGL